MLASGDTVDESFFAKFVSEFGDFQVAAQVDSVNTKAELAVDGIIVSDNQIYYALATGEEVDIHTTPNYTGTLEDLGLEILPEELEGTGFYVITNRTNIEDWDRTKSFYSDSEKLYITDAGEVFTLPGFPRKQGEQQRYYVNERKYYVGDAVTGPTAPEVPSGPSGEVPNPPEPSGDAELAEIVIVSQKITTDREGNIEATNRVEKGITLYICIEATLEGGTVTFDKEMPYPITEDGTYSFVLTGSNGTKKTCTVEVDQYYSPIVLSNERITSDPAGISTQTGMKIGGSLWIHFDAVAGDENVTISPSVPYAVTKNGVYHFTITAEKGAVLEHDVKVNLFVESGGKVNYQSEQKETANWLVWSAEGSTVKIVPEGGVETGGKFVLSGAKDYVDIALHEATASTRMDEVCRKYKNDSLGITASSIRSMRLSDVEEVVTNIQAIKDGYNKEHSIPVGDTRTYTSGSAFYTYEENGVTKTSETPKAASESNKITVKQSYYSAGSADIIWKELDNGSGRTYGDILGPNGLWLNTAEIVLLEDQPEIADSVNYGVHMVRSTVIGAYSLINSHSGQETDVSSFGVVPIISVDVSKLSVNEDDTIDIHR